MAESLDGAPIVVTAWQPSPEELAAFPHRGFSTGHPSRMKPNLHSVVADIVRRIPAMAQDTPFNNETLLTELIKPLLLTASVPPSMPPSSAALETPLVKEWEANPGGDRCGRQLDRTHRCFRPAGHAGECLF